jgi:hypothetical protein
MNATTEQRAARDLAAARLMSPGVRRQTMAIGKKLKLKGQALSKRLTGISCPIAGVSWSPPPDEQDIARRLLVYLEDRRVLFVEYAMERGDYATESVLHIRSRLTKDLEEVGKSSVLGESLVAMRAACRGFLTQMQERPYGPFFLSGLGELRARFGVHIARLACAYDLQVEALLASTLPPEVEDAEDDDRDQND